MKDNTKIIEDKIQPGDVVQVRHKDGYVIDIGVVILDIPSACYIIKWSRGTILTGEEYLKQGSLGKIIEKTGEHVDIRPLLNALGATWVSDVGKLKED